RDPDPKEAFTKHVLDVEKDHESHNTIINGYPGLFIYDDAPQKDPESDLVHYCRRGEDSVQLEKTEVNRWVDAPLLIPVVDVQGKRSVRPWGKISVDQGKSSDSLSPQDVANLSALAAVAGGALGEKIRASRDEALLTTYEEYTRELEKVERLASDERVMPRIKGWLLELFRKLFDVELALYRDYRPEDRVLVSKEEFVRPVTGCPLPETKIPPQVRVEDFPSYRRFGQAFVNDEAAVIDPKGIETYAHNRPDQVVQLSPEVQNRLSEAEVRYLNWIQSEVGIPIVVRNKVRGVIVGMSGQADAFPPDCDTVQRRFRSVAQLWFQLGELHDARTWAIATLGNCLKAWSLLQGEDDHKLYAGLAAILTAGCGLRWHRALIFRNVEVSGSGAELVYAIGGMGEKEHGRLQGYIESTERDLLALVRKRIDDPRPHGPDADSGEDRVDSLYGTYLESSGPRPRISRSDEPRLFETLQRRARGRESMPYLKLEKGDNLIRSLNERYPALFAARTTYFFPLYSNKSETEHRGSLGFIAIDNAYRPNPLEDTILALTAAIVELARDEVAARLRYRLFNGMVGALPFLRHSPQIKNRFAEFNQALGDLRPDLRNITRPVKGDPNPIAAVRRAWANLEEVVESMAHAQKRIEGFELPDKVTDLKSHLLDVINEWEATRHASFIVKDVNLEEGLGLDCDVAILDGALRCVLENAESVSRRDDEGRFFVELRATMRRDFPRFEAMVTVEITDYGPGIKAEKEPFLFIDGFTDRRDFLGPISPEETLSDHKGLGLGMARAFLLRSHGELRLQDRGGDDKGATFALHLGKGPLVAKSAPGSTSTEPTP
ncbi:MAG: ATP-binding protein, partial [Isosphaeraceae bacterium]